MGEVPELYLEIGVDINDFKHRVLQPRPLEPRLLDVGVV